MLFLRRIAYFVILNVFCFVLLANATEPAPDAHREAQWEELVPKSWQPEKAFEGLDFSNLPDDDPQVEKAYKEFMEEWAKAPVNNDVNEQRIKIPGFIVPLDWDENMHLTEFLLVPYFGACIHVPPPPPNQIIYIKPEKPLNDLRAMDAIWVYGTIYVEKNDAGNMGASGYSMKLDKIEVYQQ